MTGEVGSAELDTVLDAVGTVARQHGRADLAAEVDGARTQLARPQCQVVVCGEFKVGKSRLVNALLNAHASAPDAEVATATPVFVRHGERFSRRTLDEDAVEVTLPRRLLADGVVLVDTPGVGRGLSDSHTAATLRTLGGADGVLFVSDAGKEFSAPELEFLTQALEICPAVICVLTKTDFHPHWQRILDLDVAHLARAGLDVPVLAVSSALRQRALTARDPVLDAESGFPALTTQLRDDLLHRRRVQVADDAARAAAAALEQLTAVLETERASLAAPSDPDIAHRLEAAERQADALRQGGATWQQTLTDRVEDLRSDIDSDLSARLLGLRRTATERISEGVPAKVWPDLEPWLYRRTNEELLAHFAELRSRAHTVATDVLDQFGVATTDLVISIEISDPSSGSGSLAGAALRRASTVEAGLVAARGPMIGVTLVHTVGLLVGLSTGIALPVTAALGAALGRKTWRSARTAQSQTARGEMLRAVTMYLDECTINARKDSRDALRETERQLRDSLTRRATELHRTSLLNLENARRTASWDGDTRAAREQEVARELHVLRSLATRLRLVTDGATR